MTASLIVTVVPSSLPGALAAQNGAASASVVPPLFISHDVLTVTLTADFSALVGDRRESPDRPALLSVLPVNGGITLIGAELRTRGEFRLDPSNCTFPPLRMDVDGSDARGTVFEGQDNLKIVSSCRPGRDAYEQLVLLEYLAYRAYQFVTEESFRVRLVQLTLIDISGDRDPQTRPAFFIEENDELAERLGATIFDLREGTNLPASAFDPTSAMTTANFQYMIGNTDWSDIAGHNVEILERGGVARVVPYDFDFSGLVDAPYARPDPAFGLQSVLDRYYRGWCGDPPNTRLVLDRFRRASDDILELWTTFPGLTDTIRRSASRYLGEFFDAIETDARAERRFLRDCRVPSD